MEAYFALAKVPVGDRPKYEALHQWFFSQKFRPFIREAKAHASSTIDLHATEGKIRDFINEVGPPPGAKDQPMKTQSQAAGFRKGRRFKAQQAAGKIPVSLLRDMASRRASGIRGTSRTTATNSPSLSEPFVSATPNEASRSRGKTVEGAVTTWDMVCRDGWVSKTQLYPPSCELVAYSAPARKVEDRGLAIWQNRPKITLTDIAGLLLQATGVPSKRTCKSCFEGKTPWMGCIVSAEDGPAASKYNQSCANCWFNGRANDCELRTKKNSITKRLKNRAKSLNANASVPRKRIFNDAFGAESSSADDANDENSYAMVASDILPRCLEPNMNRYIEKSNRAILSVPGTDKDLNQAATVNRSPDAVMASDDDDDDDDVVVVRSRNRLHKQRPTPSESANGEDPRPGLGKVDLVGQDPPVQLENLGKYLDHYVRHYQHRSLDELTESRALRKLEMVAIDLIIAQKK